MTIQLRFLGTLLSAALGTMVAADAPYMGKWKFNPAQSDFGESTVTYSPNADGGMQYTADGQSYTFKVDGKDYPDAFGGTAAWKKLDANTWEVADKLNGKPLSTETVKVSGDTLTVISKGTHPNGTAFEDTVVYTRVSGGPGLTGKWKTKNLKVSSPQLVELSADGADGMVLRLLDIDAVCKAKLDGKDYPPTGPTIPAGFVLAVRKSGPRGFEMVQKMKGKELYKSTFTVSTDGKTLTETGNPVGMDEKYKAVYDRQ